MLHFLSFFSFAKLFEFLTLACVVLSSEELVQQSSTIAVIDGFISSDFKYLSTNAIEVFNLKRNDCKILKESYNSHADKVISTILSVNKQSRIILFPVVSNNEDYKFDEQLIVAALKEIHNRLCQDSTSIQIVNMSLGSGKVSVEIEMEINKLLRQWTSLVFVAAAGNSGPYKSTIQFPSYLYEVISVGTISVFSSRGPSYEMEDLTLTPFKPDFGIERIESTSIGCARFSGYISLFTKKFNRSQIESILMDFVEIADDFSVFQQGKGFIEIIQQTKQISKIFPLMNIYPTFYDLNHFYWQEFKELSDELGSQHSHNQNQYCINLPFDLFNTHLRVLNEIKFQSISNQCSVQLSHDNILNDFLPKSKYLLIFNVCKINDSEDTTINPDCQIDIFVNSSELYMKDRKAIYQTSISITGL